jgi:hypothetical protein
MTLTTEFPQLTDDMLEAARKTISAEERERPPCFSLMSADVIRRWAFAIGDANPLWLDEDYARSTRWGSILVPPTFPETAVRGSIFNPLRVKRGQMDRLHRHRRQACLARNAAAVAAFPRLLVCRQDGNSRSMRRST